MKPSHGFVFLWQSSCLGGYIRSNCSIAHEVFSEGYGYSWLESNPHDDATIKARTLCMILGKCRSNNNQTWSTLSQYHYNDVIMRAMASQITSPTIVYSTICSGADQIKHQSSTSLAFVRGIHQWPVNSPHKGPVTRKRFPLSDVIMIRYLTTRYGTNWNRKASCLFIM